MPAVLSEEVDYLGYSVEEKVYDLVVYGENGKYFNEIWILGASFNSTSEFESNNKFKCGEDSCYQKSITERKICKPGKLYLKSMTEFAQSLPIKLENKNKSKKQQRQMTQNS